ncbi:MAG: M28 family peptidase [Candidatus Thermoplasmatota archaeon]|nr:M28 family peptidase [Candidatus Thermoplasmatota archaeon]
MDCWNDTFFMAGTRVQKGGVSVTGADGKWIKQYLNNPNYKVKARIYMEDTSSSVESYNVMGEIPGIDNSKVIIVGAHYDGLWNQAAIDDAIGTGIMLGIAKYFKENNIVPKYKLKFVAFAGEEWQRRGSKDYKKEYLETSEGTTTSTENVEYMINIDMVAHNTLSPLNMTSNDASVVSKVNEIAQQINYEGKSGYEFDSIYGTPEATDAETFVDYTTVIDFGKELYKGYHRDGNNHNKGDVMGNIDDDDLSATAELTLEVVKCYAVENPPNVPSNPSPANGATGIGINTDISWTGGDPDPGDTVTYDVYFGTDSTPDSTELVSSGQTTTVYDPGTLSYSTTYYWQIVAKDNWGEVSGGEIWHFTTEGTPNSPPYTPSNPSPADGATVPINDGSSQQQASTTASELAALSPVNTLKLSWTGGDPDGDVVYYDVYFEANDNTPDVKIASDITSTSCYISNLQAGTTYYWKVVATDEHGATTYGQVWHFYTV